jgi:hypothetical protein
MGEVYLFVSSYAKEIAYDANSVVHIVVPHRLALYSIHSVSFYEHPTSAAEQHAYSDLLHAAL